MIVVRNNYGATKSMTEQDFAIFLKSVTPNTPVVMHIATDSMQSDVYSFSLTANYTFKCTRNEFKNLLKHWVVRSTEYKLSKDDRLLCIKTKEKEVEKPFSEQQKQLLEKQINEYYKTLERKHKLLGIPYRRDDITIVSADEVVLEKVYTITNGVYYIPPFITKTAGNINDNHTIFPKDLVRLKVINKGTRLYDAAALFIRCRELKELDLSDFDTANIIDMREMFAECSQLQKVALSSWDVSNVQDMRGMFMHCSSLLNLDIGAWNMRRVQNISGMFLGCVSLSGLDIGNWDVSNVCNMSDLFYSCKHIRVLNIGSWNVSKVSDMASMFSGCIRLQTLPIALWDVSAVRSMQFMFYGCTALQSLSIDSWNTSKVMDMRRIFAECTALPEQALPTWYKKLKGE